MHLIRGEQSCAGTAELVTCSLGRGRLPRLGNYRVKSRLGLPIAIEQERLTASAPGDRVIHAPEGDHLHGFTVLQECAEDSGVGKAARFSSTAKTNPSRRSTQ